MNRFVRCPHCKMPHDAAERVCPNTGLRLPVNEMRSHSREGQRVDPVHSSRMSEVPPPERRPEPLAFDAQRDRVNERATNARSGETPQTLPQTRDLQRELLGQTVGGRYKIKGVLGEGGMGTVYDAEHLGLSRQVAIKVLSPTQAKKRVAVKRFQQEARAAGAIGHPNICEVYDLGLLDDGSPYLVMEKLVGQTLAERIAKEGGLPFDDVVEVIVQVLSGLIAAHEKGIVHRDIKPENIFLARRLGCPPIIKLLDFGVSKMMEGFQNGEDALDLTRTGMVMGTPYYMSPEQARGERNLDGRVDVYACGVVMYETIIGKRPFLAPNYNALLLAIINTTPRPLHEIRPKTPPELEAIVMKAMARNRNDRYPTAKELLRQLAPPVPAAVGSSARVTGSERNDNENERLPAPPTLEERRRAPVLGGSSIGRSTRSPDFPDRIPESRAPESRGPESSRDGPSGMLRRSMTESARDRERALQERAAAAAVQSEHAPVERSTRLDMKMKRPDQVYDPRMAQPLHADDESIDIPIDVMEDVDEQEAELDALMHDEAPTEIFRPGKHPQARPRNQARPAPVAAAAPPPTAMMKGAPIVDDWDGETVVKRPDVPPPSHAQPRPPPPPPQQQQQQQPRGQSRRRDGGRPFNPDETMKLDNTGDIEIIEQARNLPRRPQR